MTALASLDGLGRGYRFRNVLGSLACTCDTGSTISDSVPVKHFTTDVALTNQGTTAMKNVLDKNGIAYTDNLSTLAVTKPDGSTVSIPALVPNEHVDTTLANLQSSLQDAKQTVAATINKLTPQQKQWGKWLLIAGGGWLAYQLFFKKSMTVNVNSAKALSGVKQINSKISGRFNINRYGNKGMEIHSDKGKVLKVFNDKVNEVENWNEAVEWGKKNSKKIKDNGSVTKKRKNKRTLRGVIPTMSI